LDRGINIFEQIIIEKSLLSNPYYDDDDCDFLNLKCYSIENVVRLSVVFTILHKKNGFSKLIKNDNMLSNKGFKSMFIKVLMCFYIMIKLPINCILMG
jgi:hypothetical protein